MKARVKKAVENSAFEPIARNVWVALKARGYTRWEPLVPQDALKACMKRAIDRLGEHTPMEELGDYLEFGVSRGSSMVCAAHALDDAGLSRVRLIGFDSFEGLPPEASREGWRPGDFRSSMRATRNHLSRKGVDLARVSLIKGWFDETLTQHTIDAHGIRKASIIMIDCDIHSASRDALRFCAPLIHDAAIIIFDDWGWREEKGEIGQKEAFEEFLQDNPEFSTEELSSYFRQARVFLVIKESR